MEKRFVTIHDVAAAASVSTATVSRVLNEPWRVVASTRDRVNASVAKLGYKPNFRARLLAHGGSGTICFLLSNRPFIHSVHAQILQGAAKEADAVGTQIVYATCSYHPDTSPSEIEMPRILGARGLIDGVIVAGTNYPNVLPTLNELDLPYVVFGTNMISRDDTPLSNAVYVDDEGGSYALTTHLLSLGHTAIRFIGDINMPWYRRRFAGYARAMTEAGLNAAPAEGDFSEGEFAMGFKVTSNMCERDVEFTAIVAGGDEGALGAIRALRGRGKSVPHDVSVVGFNDEELSKISEPPLTTVRVPMEEVGARCVEMLSKIMQGDNSVRKPITLPASVVLRESTTKFIS